MGAKDLELLKKRELEILKEFHAFCEKNSLKYILAFGTMIGTVRHQGFIPWDDDIDVTMPYEDYEKFNMIAQNSLGEKLLLQNIFTEKNYSLPFTKIQLINSCAISEYPSLCKWKNQGIYIDVFPTMYRPQNSILQKYINIHNSILAVISSAVTHKRIKHTHYGLIGRILLTCAYFINKIIPYKNLYNSMLKCALLATPNNSDNLYVCNFNVPNIMNRYQMPKDVFDNRFLMVFEDARFYMPRDYDSILRNYYGDYMMPPPLNKRNTHAFYYISDSESYQEYNERMKKL